MKRESLFLDDFTAPRPVGGAAAGREAADFNDFASVIQIHRTTIVAQTPVAGCDLILSSSAQSQPRSQTAIRSLCPNPLLFGFIPLETLPCASVHSRLARDHK